MVSSRKGVSKSIWFLASLILIIIIILINFVILEKIRQVHIENEDDCKAKGGVCAEVCGPGELMDQKCDKEKFCCVDPLRVTYGESESTRAELASVENQILAFERQMVIEAADFKEESRIPLIEKWEKGDLNVEKLSPEYQYSNYAVDVQTLRNLKARKSKLEGKLAETSDLLGLTDVHTEHTLVNTPITATCEINLKGELNNVQACLTAKTDKADCTFVSWDENDDKLAHFDCPAISEAGEHNFVCELGDECPRLSPSTESNVVFFVGNTQEEIDEYKKAHQEEEEEKEEPVIPVPTGKLIGPYEAWCNGKEGIPSGTAYLTRINNPSWNDPDKRSYDKAFLEIGIANNLDPALITVQAITESSMGKETYKPFLGSERDSLYKTCRDDHSKSLFLGCGWDGVCNPKSDPCGCDIPSAMSDSTQIQCQTEYINRAYRQASTGSSGSYSGCHDYYDEDPTKQENMWDCILCVYGGRGVQKGCDYSRAVKNKYNYCEWHNYFQEKMS